MRFVYQIRVRGQLTDDWSDWFAGQDVPAPEGISGMMMDQFSMMIQAAISGLGVALLPDYLARIEIAEGRLLPILRTVRLFVRLATDLLTAISFLQERRCSLLISR